MRKRELGGIYTRILRNSIDFDGTEKIMDLTIKKLKDGLRLV